MTKPLRPIATRVFGGVKVDENQVQKFSKVKENGATRFVIDFKNGTRIEYPAQNAKNKSNIIVHDLNDTGSQSFIFSDIAYAKIQGTKGSDDFRLRGCRNSLVDVSSGGSDLVDLSDNIVSDRKSSGNKVIQDSSDSTVLLAHDNFETEYNRHNICEQNNKTEFVEVKGEGIISEKDY